MFVRKVDFRENLGRIGDFITWSALFGHSSLAFVYFLLLNSRCMTLTVWRVVIGFNILLSAYIISNLLLSKFLKEDTSLILNAGKSWEFVAQTGKAQVCRHQYWLQHRSRLRTPRVRSLARPLRGSSDTSQTSWKESLIQFILKLTVTAVKTAKSDIRTLIWDEVLLCVRNISL